MAVAAGNALEIALQRAGQKPIAEIEAASVERVFAPRSAALPGHEAAMRQLIAGLIGGQPDYSAMTPEFADETRARLSQVREDLAPLGELRTIDFLRPLAGGDEFELTFANGRLQMAILLDPSGKIAAMSPPKIMMNPDR